MLTKLTGATFPKREDVEDIFNCLDVDGDQTVTREEFKMLTSNVEELFSRLDITLVYIGKEPV